MAQKFFSSSWGGEKQHPQEGTSTEGESLTTTLETDEQRTALTLLVADCTDRMRQRMVEVFDANYEDDAVETEPELDAGVLDDEDPSPAAEAKRQKEVTQREKDLARRERELNKAKMQDLKSATLKDFDEWKMSVIQRVGEVVNSREDEDGPEQNPGPTDAASTTTPMRFPPPPSYDDGVQETMLELYPPVENSLRNLPGEKRALILQSVLLLLLSLEHYHAQSRVLMLCLSTSLDLPVNFLALNESKIARGLLTAAESMQANEETKKRAEDNSVSRKWKVGLAAVAGAALIGVTGGLAAPLLAAGIGTVMGGLGLGATATAGYLGALAGSSVLVGGLFGAYGARMTGKMMDKYAKEVQDFAFLPTRTHHKPHKVEKEFTRLRVQIGIGGWLTDQDDIVKPWKVISAQLESFALQWELEALMNLGNSLTTIVRSAAWGLAKREIIRHTVFASLAAGLWPLALLKVSRILDNPFSVANARALKAGDILADALINKVQGERPVTLIGYGLGAKVIFQCLQRLAERKAFGLIESAVLIGTPAPSRPNDWRVVRSVVSGRVVNVYSENDYILAFLYRSHSIQYGVAGLQAIRNVKGVENVDVSDIVSGHLAFRFLVGTILQRIGFEDLDTEELAHEQRVVEEQEAKAQRDQTASTQVDLQALQLDDHDPHNTGNPQGPATPQHNDITDKDVRDLEDEIEKKNEQSYAGWMQQKMTDAGSGVSGAYEKAKMQWRFKRANAQGQSVPDADEASEISKAGVDETLFEADKEKSSTQ